VTWDQGGSELIEHWVDPNGRSSILAQRHREPNRFGGAPCDRESNDVVSEARGHSDVELRRWPAKRRRSHIQPGRTENPSDIDRQRLQSRLKQRHQSAVGYLPVGAVVDIIASAATTASTRAKVVSSRMTPRPFLGWSKERQRNGQSFLQFLARCFVLR
jgi:hypothetical protein